MKAHELARRLLELPDREVVYPNHYSGNFETVDSLDLTVEMLAEVMGAAKASYGDTVDVVVIRPDWDD